LAHFDGEGRGARALRDGRGTTVFGALGSVAVAGLAACTELAPGTDRLSQRIETSLPDASSGDSRWSCLDQPVRNSADSVVPTVDLALGVLDTVSGAVPEGLTARACGRRDAFCSMPLVAPVSPSADGMLHLAVAQGFDGYVEIVSPTSVSTMYFVNSPLMRNTVRNLGIISTVAFQGLARQVSVAIDPMLGHVLIYVFDCMGEAASDIQLFNVAGGQPFIFVDGLPQLGSDVTALDGIGGFVNVPTGFSVLEGRRAADGRVLGMTSVAVRAGWFSYSDVQPL
jgi:hypothetical protein